jgi:hypothetical protein
MTYVVYYSISFSCFSLCLGCIWITGIDHIFVNWASRTCNRLYALNSLFMDLRIIYVCFHWIKYDKARVLTYFFIEFLWLTNFGEAVETIEYEK